MATIIEKTGKNVDEALQAALSELNVSEEDVEVEVLESPSKGFLGFGKKPARIKVSLKQNSKSEKNFEVEEKFSDAEKNFEVEKKFLSRRKFQMPK